MGESRSRWSLQDKTALVTGRTRGIGNLRPSVQQFISARAIRRKIDGRVPEWKGKGFKVSGSVGDLASRTDREELMRTVSFVFNGKLNILVNNAATVVMKDMRGHTSEDLSTILTTNLQSPYHMCQLAYPLMKVSGEGNVVFISSIAGVMAFPLLSIYSAPKGAINQLEKTWLVNGQRTRSASTPSLPGPDAPGTEEFMPLIARTPLGRMEEPNKISSVVAFPCLPAASYVTGQVICVDSGYTVAGY